MEMMLSIFFLGYLVVIGLGVGVALWWSKFWGYGKAGTTTAVLGVIFVLYAIPFGDHTLGEIKKNQLCKEYGGTKIYKVIENVDGFMWGPSRQREPYQTYGYSFYESDTIEGGIFRYSRRTDGAVDEEKVTSLRSNFLVHLMPEEQIGKRHTLRRFVIIDRRTNEILASNGTVAYKGGWLGVIGSEVCPYDPKRPFNHLEFIRNVLKPSKPTS